MHTAATEQFQKYLSSAGVKGEPTFAEYLGYASILFFVMALKAAGAHPSQASLTSAMSGIHTFNAGGLTSAGFPIVNNGTSLPPGTTACWYVARFSGSTFHLVPHADPICGKY
jgi:branched-chain amino acid transport system substrate-binding protein